MADLKIKIISDYRSAESGLKKVTGSVQQFSNTLVKIDDDIEKFTSVEEKMYEAMERDINKAFKNNTSETKKYENAIKSASHWLTDITWKFGKESEQASNVSKTLAELNRQQTEYNRKQAETKKATDMSIASIQQYGREVLQLMASLNSFSIAGLDKKFNAFSKENTGTSIAILDENRVAVANAALAAYRKALEEVIAKEGIMSDATQKAYREFCNQREITYQVEEAERKLISTQEEYNQSIRDTFANLERMASEQGKLNAGNANIAFMAITGDELGVAQYTLDQYKQSLLETIAATGMNSEETKKATEKYQQQKDVVDSLIASKEKDCEVTKETNTAVQQIEPAVKKTNKALQKMGQIFWNIIKFQLILKLFNAILRSIKGSMETAAEAEQVFSKLATVFDSVANSADDMATRIANSIGVAKSTAASALSTVGDLLQAQGMSTGDSLTTAASWVEVFQDIIAFKDINMTLEEFAQNFMSGAAGNLRNFRTFGSIVKESAVNARLAAEGYDKLTGSELELQKMLARANMALEQQQNALNATKREWDSMLSVNRRLSEATKEWKENLGDALNALTRMPKIWLTNFLEAKNEAIKVTEDMANNGFSTMYDKETNKIGSDKYKEFAEVMYMPLYNYAQGSKDALEGIYSAIAEYSASESTVLTVLKEFTEQTGIATDAMKEGVIVQFTQIKALKDYANVSSVINTKTESLFTTFDNFIESVSAINGAKGVDGYSNLFDNDDSLENQLANAISLSVIEAFNSISAADLSSFASTFDIAVGEATTEDLFKGQQESLKALYETANNAFVKNGTFKENKYILDEIIAKYIEIGGKLEDLNATTVELNQDWLKVVQSVESAIKATREDRQKTGLQNRYESQGKSQEMVDYLMTIYEIDQQAKAYAEELADALVEEEEAAALVQKYVDEAYKTALQDYEIAKKKADEEKKITEELKEQDKYKGLTDFFSWRNGLTATEDTSVYSEANSWQTSQMSQLSKYASQLQELGYSAEQVRKYVDEATVIINSETEARKKLIDEQLDTEKYNGLTAWNKWLNGLTESEDTSIYAKVNSWQESAMQSMMEYAGKLEELGYSTEYVNARVREATSIINNETEARKRLIDADNEKNLFSKETDFFKWLNGLTAAEDTSAYAEVNSWQQEQMSQLSVFTTAMQALGMTTEEANAMMLKAVKTINEETEARKNLVDEQLLKNVEDARGMLNEFILQDIFGMPTNEETVGLGINESAQAKIDSMFEELNTKESAYRKALEEAGLTSDTIDSVIANAKDRIVYDANKEETDKRQEELQQYYDQYNPFKSLEDSFTTGQNNLGGGVLSGIYGILLDMVASTEAFQALSSIVTDHIVPVLDAFLKPVLPVIDVVGDLLAAIFQTILVPMFPIIVEMCALVTLIVGTVKNGFEFIANVFKWAIGSLAYKIMEGLDKIIIGDQSGMYQGTWMEKWSKIDPVDAFKKAQDELLEEVREIRGLTFDIEENTDEDNNLAVLRDLYNRQIISSETFAAETGIGRVSSSGFVQASYIDSGNNRTALYGTGTTIYIDGGNWTVQDVINEMRRQGVLAGANVY